MHLEGDLVQLIVALCTTRPKGWMNRASTAGAGAVDKRERMSCSWGVRVYRPRAT